MNKTLKFLILFFSINNVLLSQTIDEGILDQLSPEQLNQLSPEQLNQLSPEQIDLASEFLSSEGIQVSEKNDAQITNTLTNASEEIIDGNNLNGRKFGYDFFKSIPTSTLAVADIPLPNDYKISLGDKFSVILTGSKKASFDLSVKLDGTILFPELGSISVVGETFGTLKTKLDNIIQQSYVGVNIDISIKELGAKKISIVGAVKTPGSYLVNPFSTITGALAYSGGISEIGSLREILLIRANGQKLYFDLYDLLIYGDRSNDFAIEAGDTILIKSAVQFIDLQGGVKRPGIYEVTKKDNLSNLIDYGLGFERTANKSKIAVSVINNSNSKINQFETSDLKVDLKDVIQVDIFEYGNSPNSGVLVRGPVNEPGFYDLNEFKSLKDIVSALNFQDVYPWLAILEQFDKKSMTNQIVLFSLKDPETYESVKLLPNAEVSFLDLFERDYLSAKPLTQSLIEEYSLRLSIKSYEYLLPVIGKFNIKELIDYLGIETDDVNTEAIYVSPLEKMTITKDFSEMNFKAKKYNSVTFRSPQNDLVTVTVNGAVAYPGTYTLESGSTLQDIFDLTGFNNESFFKGLIFQRESIKLQQIKAIESAKEVLKETILLNSQNSESIISADILSLLDSEIDSDALGRISGDFRPNSESAKKTILRNNDNIFVPKLPYSVAVVGEVLTPTSFVYSDAVSLNYAIEMAGGFKETASEREIYIIKANGAVKKGSKNIFASSRREIEAGDTIVVPKRIIADTPIINAVLPVTSILSDLAFSAAAIESLSNN
tara:strand:- start:1961 stop:4279 length:2319 start_codon:yes stop_codon:yes gene_type:complete